MTTEKIATAPRATSAVFVKAWRNAGWHTRGFAIYDQHGHPYDWQDNGSGSSRPKGEYADVPTPSNEFDVNPREYDRMEKYHRMVAANRADETEGE